LTTRKCPDLDVFNLPDPDGYLSASDVKDVAEEVISPLPLPGVEGSSLNPGDIWLVVILACVNQNSIWDTCNDTDGTPCDGPGIPEEDRDDVFVPGFTTKEDGDGFGLASVAQIVAAHGWRIHVTDGIDGGARFDIVDTDTK